MSGFVLMLVVYLVLLNVLVWEWACVLLVCVVGVSDVGHSVCFVMRVV